jgi:hypothetical protein
MMNKDNTIAILFEYGHNIHGDMAEFVKKHSSKYISINISPLVAARNTAWKIAKERVGSYEHFMFVDNDVIPTPDTTKIFQIEGDLVCAKCEMEHEHAWVDPRDWHFGLAVATKHAVSALPLPLFIQRFDREHCTLLNCECSVGATKALRLGLKTAHSDENIIIHKLEGSWRT